MNGFGCRKKAVLFFNAGLAGLSLGINLLAGTAGAETATIEPPIQQDGIYLYGETNTARQPGKGYLIFQQSGDRIVGAMYYPQSEYTCFTGKRAATKVHLQPFEPAGQPLPEQGALQISLPGLHSISQIGSSERQTLAACQREAIALQPSGAVTVLPLP
ncbi:hypothetical protein [Altericista sp. CCNU0014]|uniref:hypothetical protein n=1 Tax=Altericista sp. CCNU0014 TaxID=3082949 RepID=UPI00384C13DF